MLHWWYDVTGGDPKKFNDKMKTLFTEKVKGFKLDRVWMVRRARKIRDMINSDRPVYVPLSGTDADLTANEMTDYGKENAKHGFGAIPAAKGRK